MSVEDKPFISPTLRGKRFEGHRIPLDVLKDLSVLKQFVFDVAKSEFLKKNDRQRVPRGFLKKYSLDLVGIDEGSAIPLICLTFLGSVDEEPPSAIQYFESARDKITKAIVAAGNEEDPREYLDDCHLKYFDRFGKSLQEKESFTFSDVEGAKAHLTRETRRRLVQSVSPKAEFTEDVVVRGSVPRFDLEKNVLTLRRANGDRLELPVAPSFESDVKEVYGGFHQGMKLAVRGEGLFNANSDLVSINPPMQLDPIDPNDISYRIEELRLLEPGWLKEAPSVAPSEALLQDLDFSFEMFFPDDLSLPYLYPTEDGGVLAEWTLDHYELSAEFSADSGNCELHLIDLKDPAKELSETLEAIVCWERLSSLVKNPRFEE